MFKILVFTFSIFIGTSAYAYFSGATPLRKLVIESQYIISGKVLFTTPDRTDTHPLPQYIARIVTLKRIKGLEIPDTIDVRYLITFCPPPPMYYAGDTILVFLVKSDEKYYNTYGNSDGVKRLVESDRQEYTAKIYQLLNIIQESNPDSVYRHTINWLVECALNPVLAWEGLYELNPNNKYIRDYLKTHHSTVSEVLTNFQKSALLPILYEDTIYYWFGLSDLVYSGNEQIIDSLMLQRLKNINENNYAVAGEYMDRLKFKNNSREMRRLLRKYKNIQYHEDNFAEVKPIVLHFFELIEE